MGATKEAELELPLLMALILLILVNINKASANVLLCNGACLTDEETLNRLYERLH